MHILYLIHADFEMPGIIEDWAIKNRFSQSYVRTFAGEKLPSLEMVDILVIMGGPQSPLETDRYPYIDDEIQFTKDAIKAGKIVLGFCLGAQIIGEACGARTEHSPFKEIGIFPITVTLEGKEDPILFNLPNNLPVAHWHNDMPGLPQDALLLASSVGCPRQIIKFGSNVYGFQCHLEVKKTNILMMLQHCKEDLQSSSPFIQSESEILQGDYDGINANMIKILNNLLDVKVKN